MKIVEYIKNNGLDKTIEDFSLIKRDYGHKFLLKYNQIESPLSIDEVQECRGLILSKDLDVLSLAFTKFFNSGESNAASIDWNSARVLKKEDGSLIQVYYDWFLEKWCIGTTGTAEAEGLVGYSDLTFYDLFLNTLKKYKEPKEFFETLAKGCTYAFELCTPFNIVVTPHGESKLVLLSVRELDKLTEIPYRFLPSIAERIGIPLVESYDLNNLEEIKSTFDSMPFSEEGYVVVDKDCNRVKIKNPLYVAAHHLKSKTSAYHIMDIIKANEVDEYLATFPEREQEIIELNGRYYDLIDLLKTRLFQISSFIPEESSKEKDKIFALEVFKLADVKQFSGFFFAYKNNKVSSVEEYILAYDNKKLYEYLQSL